MPRFRVLPYRQGSRSASALAEALGGRVLRLQGSTFMPRRDDVIINWGNIHGQLRAGRGFNFPGHELRNASNKLSFFNRMRQAAPEIIPEFWTNPNEIPEEAFPIVCRTVLAGHSGAGIVIADSRRDLVPCSLYVKYVKKQEEYRIHVGQRNGVYDVISVQRKARRRETPDGEVNWQVRNLAGGFVFVREGVNPPQEVLDAAKRAVNACGLDFGGCDVIYNTRERRAYVLEINSACGIEGATVDHYVQYFRSFT